MRATDNLALAIKDHVGLQSSIMGGTVTSVNTDGTVAVNVRGSVENYPCLSSYLNPTVGDIVQIASYGSSSFVLGPMATGPLRIQYDSLLMSFASASSATQVVTFDEPFVNAPVVLTVIASGAGSAAHWDSRPINTSGAQFTMFVFANDPGGASAWSSIPVNWIAIGV